MLTRESSMRQHEKIPLMKLQKKRAIRTMVMEMRKMTMPLVMELELKAENPEEWMEKATEKDAEIPTKVRRGPKLKTPLIVVQKKKCSTIKG